MAMTVGAGCGGGSAATTAGGDSAGNDDPLSLMESCSSLSCAKLLELSSLGRCSSFSLGFFLRLGLGLVGGLERRLGAGLLLRSGELRSCSVYSLRIS